MGAKSLEIKLTRECYRDCSHMGKCDDDVAFWVSELRPYLDELSADLVAAVLRPYGAWDTDELKDHEANLARLLWVAAGDCKDNNTCWTHMDGY